MTGPTLDLTDRELQILDGISTGMSNADIGRWLYITPDTVKSHCRRIFAKLDVTHRAHAVAVALRQGLIR